MIERAEILYVSSVPSPREFSRMKQKHRANSMSVLYGMPESGFKFHTLIQQGLAQQPGVVLESICGRSVNIKHYQGLVWPEKVDSEGLYKVTHLGFISAPLLKQITTGIAFYFTVAAWRWRTRNSPNRFVILDGSYVSALPFILAPLFVSNIRKIGLFCDVYPYMAEVSDASNRKARRYSAFRKIAIMCYQRLDGMIFLTSQMNDVLNPMGLPHVVIEGVVEDDEDGTHQFEPTDHSSSKRIVYAGAIREEYGLSDLLVAFRKIRNPKIKLTIYGEGDYRPEIEKASLADERITWGGVLSGEEILEEEAKAWLLINPRQADREFSKYSFPSKTLEYLRTGTPVLMAKLPGLRDEYLPYVYLIDGFGADGIASSIEKLLEKDEIEMRSFGIAGQKFVLAEKGKKSQAIKILDFMTTRIGQ